MANILGKGSYGKVYKLGDFLHSFEILKVYDYMRL